MAAAQRFFHKTLVVAEEAPQQVTTDGHDSYPRAIREVLGHNVEHRDNAYLNRRIEQVRHQAALLPHARFGALRSAQRFCSAYEEVRQYLRPRRWRKQFVSLARQRRRFVVRVQALQASFLAH
jgi:putative transposase